MEELQQNCPSVLQSILTYLKGSDLANCRLVNFAFNYEACKILQRRRTISISSLDELLHFCEVFEHSIQLISIKIQPFVFNCDLFSRSMQNLDEPIRTLSTKDLRNLESVNLKLHDLVRGPNEPVIRSFINALFSSSRNLKSIYSWSRWDKPGDGYLLLKDAILDNVSSISSTLRSLTIMEMLSDDNLNRLKSCKFPNLESVEISIDGNAGNEVALKDFLVQYSPSLRSLSLAFVSGDWKPVAFCPQLPPPGVYLKELEMLSLKFYQGGMISLENVPKLKELQLYRCSDLPRLMSSGIPQQDFTKSQPLQKLEVSGWSCSSEDFLYSMPFWFSFLTILKIEDVQFPQLSEIFKEANRLQNLTIKYCRGVNDETICGGRPSLLESVCLLNILKKDSSEEEIAGVILDANAVPRGKPYIGDLKELRFLTLKGDFSDVSILYGIVNCMKLKKLHLASFTHNLTWRSRQVINHGLKDLVELSMLDDEEVVLP